MASTYTVKSGDTLWNICIKNKNLGCSTTAAAVEKIAKLNNISDPDVIHVGQVLKLDGTVTDKNTTSKTATIKVFGLVNSTDRDVFASWTWTKSNTDHYQVRWWYGITDGVGTTDIGIVGSDTTTDFTHAIYTAPENATHVSFYVKPVSKKYTKNNKETSYWTADWSTKKTYYFKNNPPSDVSAPSVTIDKYKLTARLDNLDTSAINGTQIEFEIVKNDAAVYKKGKANIKTGVASYSCTIDHDSKYKVRCRAVRGSANGEWSDYSANTDALPGPPNSITKCSALDETSVSLTWSKSKTAETYDIEYTTEKKEYLTTESDKTVIKNGIESNSYILTGLESGKEYFFRVRAVKGSDQSDWSKIVSIVLGKPPSAPTTWSSTTTAIVGEPVILYWVHNTEDNSSQEFAELEVIAGKDKTVYKIQNTANEDEKDKTSSYPLDTSKYSEGTTIKWRVRTAGITNALGEWSVQRTIQVNAPATLALNVTDKAGHAILAVKSYPFYIYGVPGPSTQTPIGYHVEIVSNEIYETVDSVGNPRIVNKGEQVYSRYFNTHYALRLEMSAGSVDLHNNISYTVNVTVTMDTGLSATNSDIFTVSWTDDLYEPNAEIAYDPDTYCVHIHPYCTDEDEKLIKDVSLSVYRREFDGSFTELMSDIDNISNTFITDPHPALDYARYRIVATTKSTGAVSYTDLPGYPIGEKAIIIQWNEDWSTYDAVPNEVLTQPAWSGSLLRLPYNVDVSDSNKPDVAHVEYIGRSHPISYYGTQLGSNATWNVVIEKDDTETLYGLRRLANWMGDVYVREPSGSGYWANVTVKFSQKHRNQTIPVTLDIVRVEGGI